MLWSFQKNITWTSLVTNSIYRQGCYLWKKVWSITLAQNKTNRAQSTELMTLDSLAICSHQLHNLPGKHTGSVSCGTSMPFHSQISTLEISQTIHTPENMKGERCEKLGSDPSQRLQFTYMTLILLFTDSVVRL